MRAKADMAAGDIIHEMQKRKEALLQAALEYNAFASQFSQEAVAIDFKTGTGCGILSLNRKPRSQCRRWAAS